MKKILLLIVLSISLAACSTKTASSIINDNEFGGSSFGVAWSNSNENQTIHSIKPNENYSPRVTVINHLPTRQTFRVFFFVDFKQTPFIADSKNYEHIDLTLEPDERKDFTISLPNIPNGKHDFLATLIRSPDYILKEAKVIPETQYFSYRRCILVVGNDGKSTPTEVKYSKLEASDPVWQSNSPFITLDSSMKSISEAATLLTKLPSNLIINYNVSKKENQKFAVILLSNIGQIQTENSFYELNALGKASFQIKTNGYPKKFPFNLYAITVSQPFSDSSPETLTISSVHSSNFISIKK
ncbi:hypothetical protein ACFQZT_30805 [Paenibacillus sp. GCM10027628]|uniref:hypothetical protein n=1 Tax=Paenibacillus sp. GCM10027628 TaxID=3273413 RepID=UPI003636FB77